MESYPLEISTREFFFPCQIAFIMDWGRPLLSTLFFSWFGFVSWDYWWWYWQRTGQGEQDWDFRSSSLTERKQWARSGKVAVTREVWGTSFGEVAVQVESGACGLAGAWGRRTPEALLIANPVYVNTGGCGFQRSWCGLRLLWPTLSGGREVRLQVPWA